MDGGSVRILHVDDEPDFAEMAAEFLAREDERFAVETATSVDEGLDRLAAAEYDCVVSDYEMPRTDGIAFLDAVREQYPDLPFILFTGKGSEEVASDAIAAGVTDYLQKGRDASQYELLANRITNAVEQFRAERRARLQEREYRELFEQAPIMHVLVRDERGWPVIEDCNDRFVEALGYDREEVIGRPTTDFFTADSASEVYDGGYERALTGQFGLEERTLVTTDGELIHTLLRASPRLDEHGNVVGLQTLYLDVTERTEREEELELYETMLETVPDGVYALDEGFEYVAVNQGMTDLTGYSNDELVGSHVSLVVGEEVMEEAKRQRERLKAGGIDDTVMRAEHHHRTADGERIPMEVRYRALPPDEDGEFRGTAGVLRDVSERKRRERELERYETIVEASGDAVYTLDADGRFTFVNDAFCELVGYAAEELFGEHVSIVMTDEDIARSEAIIRELLGADAAHETLEMDLLRADGERVACETHIALLPPDEDGDEAFRGTTGIHRDITERKRREDRLREERDRLTALFEDAPRPIVESEITPDGHRIIDVNDAFEATFGYDRAEVVGRGVPETLVPEAELPDHERLRDRVTAGESRSLEVERITADGTRTFLLDIVPYGTESIPADGAFATYTDITEREAHERELERKNERLEEFASVVSHDLRNPLNVAEGNVELAREECDSEHLDAAARAIDRMDTLVADLLTLAREGEQVDDVEPVGLADLVEACWNTIDTADATLVVATERAVRADRSRLAQLLENLVHNAVEHARPDVTITVGDLDGDAGFYVEDDGPGIPPDERENVFAHGYSTADGGTGFGLAIVREIAGAHGWEVALAESNGGARFEITGVDPVA